MNFKVKDQIVNNLTGEVGTVISTHTYPAGSNSDGTASLATPIVSVKFTNDSKWVLADCIKKL